MPGQVPRIPEDATHLVVSIGGNDALGCLNLLDAPATSTAGALRLLGQAVDRFEANYRSTVRLVLDRGLPVTLCTIYNGAFEDPDLAARARIALMMFNDVILRAAFEYDASAIELRLIWNENVDYANPIEPSGEGGNEDRQGHRSCDRRRAGRQAQRDVQLGSACARSIAAIRRGSHYCLTSVALPICPAGGRRSSRASTSN